MFPLIGGLIGAGANLLGSFFSSQSASENAAATNAANERINAQNAAAAAAAQALGSTQYDRSLDWQQTQFGIQQQNRLSDYYTSEARRAQDIGLQKEFAQSGVRWKVADAIAAGLHPLYALGASGVSYASPAGYSGSPVGGFSGPGSSHSPLASSIPHQNAGDTSMGRGLAAAGQDIGRAINATRTQDERVFANLAVERGALENELLRSQIAKNRQQSNPPMPTTSDPGMSGDLPQGFGVKDKAMDRIPHSGGREQAAIADIGYGATGGGFVGVPSKDMKERIEDNFIQEALWAYRNNILPTIGINRRPPTWDPPEGTYWSFNPYKQEYEARKRTGGFYRQFNSPAMGGSTSIGAP